MPFYRWGAEHKANSLEVEKPGSEPSPTGSRQWQNQQATDSACPKGDPAWEAIVTQRSGHLNSWWLVELGFKLICLDANTVLLPLG